MILIGLTGSLATGKSTVSSILSSRPYSLPIIDADHLARAVTAPGTTGYTLILRTFGPTTPDLLLPASSSTSTSPPPLNRAVLGRLVFGPTPAQQRARARLNAIVHPLVRLAMLRSLLYYFILGHWAVVLDIPLLYETGLDIYVSVVIMVSVSSPAVQMARLRARDTGLSAGEARDRVGSQMGIFEKVGRTRGRGRVRGKVVGNDGGVEELRGVVGGVVREIWREGRGGWWGWWLVGSPVGLVGVCGWEVARGWWARRRWEREAEGGRGRGGEGKML